MSTIQDLINAIPDAQDGDVINSVDHNTIKTALKAIAGQSGSTSGQTNSVTLPPNFLPVTGGGAPWTINLGVAVDAGRSNGWIPLYLPEGALITQMTVNGVITAPGTPGFVSLVIQPLTDTAVTTLILIDLSTGGNPFNLTGTPNVTGAGATGLKDFQTVKNAANKYLVHAQTLSSAPNTVTINTVRVIFTMP
jgi:hypothetical protein